MGQMNGNDDLTEEQENELRDQLRVAARQVSVIEPGEGKAPFEQKSHDLLVQSIHKVANQWVEELRRVRDNTKVIEELIEVNVNAVTTAITKLHLLGQQARIEADRGHQVSETLASELERMMAEPR